VSATCGLCDPRKLRSGICDYHIREIVKVAAKHNITNSEATDLLYSEAVEDSRNEGGKHEYLGS
jgi:hypothetical protein